MSRSESGYSLESLKPGDVPEAVRIIKTNIKEADVFDSSLAFIGLTRDETLRLAKEELPDEAPVDKLSKLWIHVGYLENMGIAPTEGTKFLLCFPPNADRDTFLIPSDKFKDLYPG